MKKSIASISSTRECCWVPLCKGPINKENKLLPLPSNSQSREIWLALAGKPVTTPGQKIKFCSNHFSPDKVLGFGQDNKLPLRNIPEKICHLCLSIIDSNKSSKETVHVLSKYISTEMPACMEELLPYFSPCKSEPLHKIISLCIPDLDIQCNPPPLVCNSCFENIWLFHIFKVSAREVEEALKSDIPIEHYGKMVLCRSCPVRSGTNFVHVEEESTKGQLLKKILRPSSTEKDPLPLRLCKKCFEVVTRLDLFYRSCQTAQKKMNSHNEMEKKLAQRRNKLDEFIKMSMVRKQDICTFFEDSNKKRADDSLKQTKLSKNARSTDVENEKIAIISSLEGELKKFCKTKGPDPKMFYSILQQLSNSKESEYCTAVLNRWHQMKSTALTNQKEGKLTELDKMILSLVEYEQTKEKDKNEATNSTDGVASSDPSDDPSSTDGFGSSKSDSSDSESSPVVESTSKSQGPATLEAENLVGKKVKSKYVKKQGRKKSQMKLLTTIEREFYTIQREKTLVKNAMEEIFARLLTKEYCKSSLCDIKREWSSMINLAYSHRKTNLTDQDKRIFQLKRTIAEYKRNRTFLFYPSYFKISLTNKEKKIDGPIQSTSHEVTNTTNIEQFNSSSTPNQMPTIDQTVTTRGRWKEEDCEILFNVVEKEFNDILQNKGIVPSKCWKMILSIIFKKNLFKSYNEIELNMLWQKIRRRAIKHESKGIMTTLDRKIMKLLEKHKQMEDKEHSAYVVESHLRKGASYSDSGNESTSTNSSVPAKRFKANQDNNQKGTQLETKTKGSGEKSQPIDKDNVDMDSDNMTVNSNLKTLENGNDEEIDSDATEIDDDESFVNSSEHISWNELNVEIKKGPLSQNKIRQKLK